MKPVREPSIFVGNFWTFEFWQFLTVSIALDKVH